MMETKLQRSYPSWLYMAESHLYRDSKRSSSKTQPDFESGGEESDV